MNTPFTNVFHRGLLAAVLCLGGALAAPTAQAQANNAWVARDSVLLAGPSEEYPVVRDLQANTTVLVYGCLREYIWCDAAQGGLRGWVYADDIEMMYRNRRVVVGSDVTLFALPWVTFSLNSYWDRHYRTSFWYTDRLHWSTLNWNRPNYGWHHHRDRNWDRRGWGWRPDRDGRHWDRRDWDRDGRDWDRNGRGNDRDRGGRNDWDRNRNGNDRGRDNRDDRRNDGRGDGRGDRRDGRDDNGGREQWRGTDQDRRRQGLGMEGVPPARQAPLGQDGGRSFSGAGEGRREFNRPAPVTPPHQGRSPDMPRAAPQGNPQPGVGGRGRPEREDRSGKGEERERRQDNQRQR